MAHITGGGMPGNLGRALPPGLDAVADTSSWEVPALFGELQKAGQVPREEMFRVFNMGVGMVVIVPPENADAVIRGADASGVGAWAMGEIRPGSGDVILT
jgi:phosphoribosylformylglycinamidine cyclo-ligase